ncbi:MAG: class I SAM-dependent methyltransferase [Pseudomonadota bacterium]
MLSGDVTRFDGLAETYDAYRPGYPRAVFEMMAEAAPKSPRCAVDVGAGTGISTEGLIEVLGPDWLMVGIEPGMDMRRVLVRRFANSANFQASDGRAEAMKLPDSSAALIIACTAFHWFDRDAFFSEAARVLVPEGVLAIIRNRRVEEGVVPALDAYVAANLPTVADFKRREKSKEPSVRELQAVSGFKQAKSKTFSWSMDTTARDLVDLYLTRSTTSGVVRQLGLPSVKSALTDIVEGAHGAGRFSLKWETTVKWAKRI